ncbi:hypothetical protein [Archangium lansingense]|uniref:Uncharacterized protein n=1 Tax=Archangium lansingense TaxID=2995310 RepID=A0ABT4ANJ5_9BACT|nr:hypothetical protein [Archangium lansinium]MCY1083264.1 hypothetical protein [Archangium lansinium]
MSGLRYWKLFLLLSALPLVFHAACSASTPTLGEPWDEFPASEELLPQGVLLTGPGPTDVENKFLPAVMVTAAMTDSTGRRVMKPCSGVLIHPRLVITAGHCICLSRRPTPQELLPARGKPQEKSRAVARDRELVGVTLTEIIDKDSQCASEPLVTAVQYGRSPKGTLRTQTLEYLGRATRNGVSEPLARPPER